MPAETEGKGAVAPGKFKNVRAADFRSIYANNTAFQAGVFDFSMFFGEVVGIDQSTESITVEQKVKIIMSPLHAKIFIASAFQQLQLLEERFGEIKIPPGVMATDTPQSSPAPLPTEEA